MAQTEKPEPGEKYALLVGVRKYRANSGLKELKYAEKDVTDLAELLRKGGYRTVRLLTQADGSDDRALPRSDNIRRELGLLLDNKQENHTVLVAFAGHGVQFKNEPDKAYFCPADGMVEDRKSLISLTEVYQQLERCRAGCKLLLCDACRNDPVDTGARSAEQVESITKPQRIAPPGGVAALFSCSAGQRAYERDELGHGVFFHFVMEGLKAGKTDVLQLAAYTNEKVYDYVSDKIGEKQTPELKGNVRARLPLMAGLESRPSAPTPTNPSADDKKRITNSIDMKLVLIPPGEFDMGSPPSEVDRLENESLHHVRITKAFYMGIYEVTQAEYQAVTGKNPSEFKGLDLPVERVSWDDAVIFCRMLSDRPAEKAAGRLYRLPTEAEWEYACRAETKTTFHCGNSLSFKQATFNGDQPYGNAPKGPYLGKTTRVGTYEPNAFGLYDMHGNVWEFCQDGYDDNYYKKSPQDDPRALETTGFRVMRGGSWNYWGKECRSAYRGRYAPGNYVGYCGFRVAMTASENSPNRAKAKESPTSQTKPGSEETDETRAAQKLRFAKKFFNDAHYADATEYCEEIVKRWPKTKAAEEAKGLLEKIKAKK